MLVRNFPHQLDFLHRRVLSQHKEAVSEISTIFIAFFFHMSSHHFTSFFILILLACLFCVLMFSTNVFEVRIRVIFAMLRRLMGFGDRFIDWLKWRLKFMHWQHWNNFGLNQRYFDVMSEVLQDYVYFFSRLRLFFFYLRTKDTESNDSWIV